MLTKKEWDHEWQKVTQVLRPGDLVTLKSRAYLDGYYHAVFFYETACSRRLGNAPVKSVPDDFLGENAPKWCHEMYLHFDLTEWFKMGWYDGEGDSVW